MWQAVEGEGKGQTEHGTFTPLRTPAMQAIYEVVHVNQVYGGGPVPWTSP